MNFNLWSFSVKDTRYNKMSLTDDDDGVKNRNPSTMLMLLLLILLFSAQNVIVSPLSFILLFISGMYIFYVIFQ